MIVVLLLELSDFGALIFKLPPLKRWSNVFALPGTAIRMDNVAPVVPIVKCLVSNLTYFFENALICRILRCFKSKPTITRWHCFCDFIDMHVLIANDILRKPDFCSVSYIPNPGFWKGWMVGEIVQLEQFAQNYVQFVREFPKQAETAEGCQSPYGN